MIIHANTSTEYAMYLRKSRKDLEAEAHGEGDTLARHERKLLELAASMKVTVTQVYREVVSGETIADRPEMQKLLDDVEAGKWKGILCMEVERLARGDTIDQGVVAQAFTYSNTKIITPQKIYDPSNEFDAEYFEFGLYMSRREYKTITRRIQAGILASVKEGKWVANKAPYGWRRVKLENEKGWVLTPAEETAPYLKAMYDWAYYPQTLPSGETKRLSPQQIANRLNAMNVPAPNGGQWIPQSVRIILTNPANAGWVRWGAYPVAKEVSGRAVKRTRVRAEPGDVLLIKGRHEGQIPQAVYDEVQAFLGCGTSRPGPQSSMMRNPLSGLVVCGDCGHKMVRRLTPGTTRASMLCPINYCHMVSSYLDAVEQAILDSLAQWLEELELHFAETRGAMPAQADPAQPLRAALPLLEKEMAQITSQEEKAYDLVERGVYTPEVFLQRSKSLADRKQEVQDKLNHIRAELSRTEREAQAHLELVPRIRSVLAAYPIADTAQEKNDLLKSILDHVVYNKTKGNRHGGGDMSIILYPKLPK